MRWIRRWLGSRGRSAEGRAAGLIASLRGAGWEEEDRLVRKIVELGDEAVDALALAMRDASEQVRGRAAEALGDIGAARVVPMLVHALGDPHFYVRQKALSALGRMRVAEAMPEILLRLNDESRTVREVAIRVLERIGDAGVVEPLLRVARADPNFAVRQLALRTATEMRERLAAAAASDPARPPHPSP